MICERKPNDGDKQPFTDEEVRRLVEINESRPADGNESWRDEETRMALPFERRKRLAHDEPDLPVVFPEAHLPEQFRPLIVSVVVCTLALLVLVACSFLFWLCQGERP